MQNILQNSITDDSNDVHKNYTITVADLTKPNKIGLTQTYCDSNFFDPEKHKQHMKHMNLDDAMYIKHMIPHHQVAVDISYVLLKNSKNDFMIYFANRIIINQQEEIILLNDMLNKKNYVYNSELII